MRHCPDGSLTARMSFSEHQRVTVVLLTPIKEATSLVVRICFDMPFP